jgi:hypothetical protein
MACRTVGWDVLACSFCMVLQEKSPVNTPEQFVDWCAIASVWQNAETRPGVYMYDYGEADQEGAA